MLVRCIAVSIHAPVWGATVAIVGSGVTAHVSIHAPVWGATYKVSDLLHHSPFQSTHPCGVRHANTMAQIVGDVSIHAPVWGATAN